MNIEFLTERRKFVDAPGLFGGTDMSTADNDFVRMLAGYSLTTAEIIYRLPDHPALMQSYIWQDYDLHPRFPKLKSFLDFWTHNLEGKLHQVLVAHSGLIKPCELKLVGAELRLH
jgi:uncharacterized protein Usg